MTLFKRVELGQETMPSRNLVLPFSVCLLNLSGDHPRNVIKLYTLLYSWCEQQRCDVFTLLYSWYSHQSCEYFSKLYSWFKKQSCDLFTLLYSCCQQQFWLPMQPCPASSLSPHINLSIMQCSSVQGSQDGSVPESQCPLVPLSLHPRVPVF